MSLLINNDNSLENIEKCPKREINIKLKIKKCQLNPIKIYKANNSSKYNKNQKLYIDIKNKNQNPFLSNEEEKLIKNNKLLSYLDNFSNTNMKKDYFFNLKDFSLKSRNRNNKISNCLSSTKTMSPKKVNLTSVYSPEYKNKKLNEIDFIKLNSLFKLPLKKNNNQFNSPKRAKNSYLITDINNKINFNSLPLLKQYSNNNCLHQSIQIHKVEDLEKDKYKKYDNINSFMKFKYYEDVNEKFEKKLRDDSFIDRGIKDKIIKIGKVGIFWRNVFEYCGSFIFAEKFKNIKKQSKKDYMRQEGEELNINKYNKTPNKVLYTNLIVNRLIHFQKKRINNT